MDRRPRESYGCSGASLLQEVGTHPIGHVVWYTPEDVKTMRAGPNEVNIRPASTQRTSAYNPGQWPKALEDYVINNPLPLGDRWNIVKMLGDEFKVQAVESVMVLHAKAYDYGSDGVIVSVVGRGLDGKTFKKQISHNDKLIGKLTAILQGLAKSMQKTAGGSVEAGTSIDNTKTAASFPSYNPVQTLALSRVKDRAKAARMRAKAIKAVEEALRVVRGSDSQNMKYVVDRAEADLQSIKRMPETSDLYQLITDTSTLNDHFSRLRWEASQLGLREAKMVAHRQNAVPADVERYVEEVRAANPDYDDAKIWATAWSIYCAYKNPDSEHCKKPTDEYFPGRSASDKALRARLIRLAHENRSLRADLLPLLSKRAGVSEVFQKEAEAVLQVWVNALLSALGSTAKAGPIELEKNTNMLPGLPGRAVLDRVGLVCFVEDSRLFGPAGNRGIHVHLSARGRDAAVSATLNHNGIKWVRNMIQSMTGSDVLRVGAVSGGDGPEPLARDATPKINELMKTLNPIIMMEGQRRRATKAFDEFGTILKAEIEQGLQTSGFPLAEAHVLSRKNTDVTGDGAPYDIRSLSIDHLVDPDGLRDRVTYSRVGDQVHEVISKVLGKFTQDDVVAKLSQKPALWENDKYNTNVLIYFKDGPAPKMKFGSEDATLRSRLVKLAHTNPALRPHLLPLLSKKAGRGPDAWGDNWNPVRSSGGLGSQFTWFGDKGDVLERITVRPADKRSGDGYIMQVKLAEGSQYVSEKTQDDYEVWFKRASKLYADSTSPEFSMENQPDGWRKLNGLE